MERINKEHTYLQRNQYNPYFFLIALPLLAFGGYLALAGFGAVRLVGKAYVPLPVIGFIGVMFASLGFFIAFAALRLLFRRQPPSASPYLQDYPWKIQGDSVTLLTRSLRSLLRTLFLLSFTIPVNYIVWIEDGIPLLVRAGVVLFDLLPLWMLFRTAYLFWQGLKYGRISLAYGRFPFHPGQRGTVYLTPNFLFPLQAELRYVMERREVQHSSGRIMISHRCYQLATCLVEVANLGADQPLKLTFELPSASEQVNHLNDKAQIYYWEIALKSQQSGSDFDATFLLPVYAPDAAYPALIAAADGVQGGF